MAAAGRVDRAVVFQDIRDCPGPLSALTELNAAVKEKFHHLRGRIQVRLPAGAAPVAGLPSGCLRWGRLA